MSRLSPDALEILIHDMTKRGKLDGFDLSTLHSDDLISVVDGILMYHSSRKAEAGINKVSLDATKAILQQRDAEIAELKAEMAHLRVANLLKMVPLAEERNALKATVDAQHNQIERMQRELNKLKELLTPPSAAGSAERTGRTVTFWDIPKPRQNQQGPQQKPPSRRF